jgi:hypothetical protein
MVDLSGNEGHDIRHFDQAPANPETALPGTGREIVIDLSGNESHEIRIVPDVSPPDSSQACN